MATLDLSGYQSDLTESSTNSNFGNGTAAIIASLVFAESKSVRTSTIILSAFNICAAFTTASSILWDCYWASRQCSPGFKSGRKFCVSHIHPAETFPLVVSVGIVIQGLVFAASQGTGLQSSLVTGCSVTAQFMLPALFLVPYIQVVFGLECAIRSFRSSPFRARGKYDVTICLATVFLMTLATWIPTHIRPQRDHCFASLIWFISSFSCLALIIMSIAGILAITSAATIFCRLSSFTSVDRSQRIAASRMVYYLAVALISIGFVVPFFITMALGESSFKTGMMATVVLNLSGLMTGLLQLFLRSNTATTSFKPKDTPGWGGNKHEVRLWGPNELGFGGHMLQPVSIYDDRIHSHASLRAIEKDRAMSLESLTSPPMIKSPDRSRQNSSTIPPSITIHNTSSIRGPSQQTYSLFPPEEVTSPSKAQLPATTFTLPTSTPNEDPFSDSAPSRSGEDSVYSLGSLLPPPPLFDGAKGPRRARNSSMISTATIQIGLHLSQAPFTFGAGGLASPALRPTSPALPRLQTSGLSNEIELENRDSLMKTLPPVPRVRVAAPPKPQPENGLQLSPSVYSPSNSTKSLKEDQNATLSGTTLSPKVYSPEGVGRSESLRRNESVGRNGSIKSRRDPPLEQSTEQKEGEWI